MPLNESQSITVSLGLNQSRRTSSWADYLQLIRPRMNALVIMTTLVGYLVAAGSHIDWLILFDVLLGTAMTAAGASVINQFIERDSDARMPRTANRPIPAGRVVPIDAMRLGLSLSLAGIVYLLLFVNVLAALLAMMTLLSYVLLYTPLKQHSSLCTLAGAISGALPPMIGSVAFHNAILPDAVALGAILFIWQIPHFLAIAIIYRDQYAAGGLRMLSVADPSLHASGRQILLYLLVLIPVSLMPVWFQMASASYIAITLVLGIFFLAAGIPCVWRPTIRNARRLFFASIFYLLLLLVLLSQCGISE